MITGIFFVAIVIAAIIVAGFKVIQQWEVGLIYTFGQYTGLLKPGPRVIIPFVQNVMRVDMRIRTEDVPPQDVISKDNVSVRVSAIVFYRVVEPNFAINRVENFMAATSELAQTTLRSVLGKHELDDMLANREQLNSDIQEILDTQTEGWGIKVTNVEIKQVDIDQSMVRAIAKQAEAERERRAKVINAEGELQAAKQLDEAATILAGRPETMQLRYLNTLDDFTNAKGSTVVLPLPLDMLMKGIQSIGGKG